MSETKVINKVLGAGVARQGFIGTKFYVLNEGKEILIMGADGSSVISDTEFVKTEVGYIIENMVEHRAIYQEPDDILGAAYTKD